MSRYILPMLCSIFITPNIIMTNHILQWNCRSVKANYEELNILINEKETSRRLLAIDFS